MGATRTAAPISGVTFDTGALIAIERGDGRMIALLQEAIRQHRHLRVPAGVIGQAWRDGRRQAMLARFLRTREVEVHALDEHIARTAGVLCGAAGTDDVIDATVILTARPTNDVILTSDPDDLRRLDPAAQIERV